MPLRRIAGRGRLSVESQVFVVERVAGSGIWRGIWFVFTGGV